MRVAACCITVLLLLLVIGVILVEHVTSDFSCVTEIQGMERLQDHVRCFPLFRRVVRSFSCGGNHFPSKPNNQPVARHAETSLLIRSAIRRRRKSSLVSLEISRPFYDVSFYKWGACTLLLLYNILRIFLGITTIAIRLSSHYSSLSDSCSVRKPIVALLTYDKTYDKAKFRFHFLSTLPRPCRIDVTRRFFILVGHASTKLVIQQRPNKEKKRISMEAVTLSA